MTYAPLGPSVATEIQLMLDAGESLVGISRRIGVSRDRIRTVIRKYKLEKPEPYSQFSRSEVTRWAELLIKGKGYMRLSEEVGISREKIRDYLEHYGFNLKEIKKLKSEHKHDGKTFGYWTVIPGSHTRVNNNAVLTCECVCGEVRQVSLSNLLGGCTRSCGCKGYEERTTYPWKCEETGEIIPSTAGLAVRLGINHLGIHRLMSKGVYTVQDGEHHWTCQLDSGATNTGAANTWVNQSDGTIIRGAQDLAELCGLSTFQLNDRKRTSGEVTDLNGDIWKVIET